MAEKPQAVIDYNNCKAFIDLSDQMKSYSNSLRRVVKWYRKLAVELLTGSITNAYIMYKSISKNKIQITAFREEITKKLLEEQVPEEQVVQQEILQTCRLKKMESARRRCTVCYENLKTEQGRDYAMKKCKQTPYKCDICETFFCVECFFVKHKTVKI
ncbi:uncharacterized protein [Diabrotica undecimpunctata]|uniref:uncharacterized protein n=1 Tax=Diabrotica undecimpunctata TaxID=50387 RepID=UPI003B632B75